MNVLDYGNYNNEKIVIALGYFDSIHSGHQMLLKETINLSKELNALSAVLLFTGNFKGEKDVFTLEERLIKIKALNQLTLMQQTLQLRLLKQKKRLKHK